MRGRLCVFTMIFLGMMLQSVATATPPGYTEGAVTLAQTESGVFVVDPDGIVYYGHDASKGNEKPDAWRDGNRGASNEIWKYDPATGTHTLFYSAAAHPGAYQINSATGIAIDTTTTPWTYYIADQAPDSANPYTTGAVWIAYEQAGNEDGDLDDSTDTVALFTDPDAVVYIAGIIRDNDTGDIFVTNAEGIAGNPMVYRMNDANHNDYIDSGEIVPYFNLPASYVYAGGLVFDISGNDVIFTHDSAGKIYRLEDLNGDGDVIGDSGAEAVEYADIGFTGGIDIDIDPEGDIFVMGTDWSGYPDTVTRIYQVKQTSPPYVTLFDDLSDIAAGGGLFAFDNGATFQPGVPGAILYGNYTTPTWGDPAEILTWQSSEYTVPALSFPGLLALLLLAGFAVTRKN